MKLRQITWGKAFAMLAPVLGWAVMPGTAPAQELVSNFSAGQASGVYSYSSWTPKTLGELLKGNLQAESVNVTGHLFLPPAVKKFLRL